MSEVSLFGMVEQLEINFDDVGVVGKNKEPEVINTNETIAETENEETEETKKEQRRIGYFDLETQKSADDVGGWDNAKDMLMSIGVVYFEPENEFKVYTEEQVEELIDDLFSCELVIGYNVINFDYSVLTHYTKKDFSKINTVDMARDFEDKTGHRTKLDNIAHGCLEGAGKSADGLMALQWWKEGKVDLIVEYCKQDVAVTRDVYKYGLQNKKIKYDDRYKGMRQIEIEWKERVNFPNKYHTELM